MNVLNIVLVGLIFFSLVVIIAIFGRNIKKIKEFSSSGEKEKTRTDEGKPGRAKRLIGGSFNLVKNAFVTLAEWIVKHAKKLLLLVHFWLIKIKRQKKGDEAIDEIEAKEQLINEEEKNLNKVIHDDLGRSDEESRIENSFATKEIGQKDETTGKINVSIEKDSSDELIQGENSGSIQEYDQEEKSENKIKQFFFSKNKEKDSQKQEEIQSDAGADLMQEENQFNGNEFYDNEKLEHEEKGFFKKALNKFNIFSKTETQEGAEENGQVLDEKAERNEFGDDFSDGVVKVEKTNTGPNEEMLMKEVVVAKNNGDADQDDELGVDRKIMEKKILQKIENDPKNVENYKNLAELYIKMKNYSDAENTYKFILKASPRDVDAKRKIEKIKLLKRLG